ncbi:DUF4331 domain-containing protein [Henriciella litoralis]|uniref:DUF4331 domain-containing protein n=1 Tax=Henriciella litoralis TaxID=568102 RepID=UPI0009FEE1E2|nr:DUF4331 domain-containing protein [Henriciella litoralis]
MKLSYVSLVALSIAAAGAVITPALASSHREAPGITEQPKVDGTDFYMFRSYENGRSDYVTFIANYQPLQAPYGGPNYFTMDPDALYEIHVDVDGDANEDITFQFDFDNNLVNGTGITVPVGDKNLPIALRQAGQITAGNQGALGETETYELSMVTGDRRTGARSSLGTFTKPVDNIGNKTLPDYDAYANSYISDVSIPGCGTGRVFVGQRAEAFAVNLGEIFDLVNLVPIDGDVPLNENGDTFPGGITQDRANDDLVGKANVTSLALEVPISCLDNDGDGIIGAWTTASLPQAEIEDPSPTYEQTSLYGGAFVQQSRLSAPLVNEVVIGLPDKDLFNAAEPTQDSALADYVTNPTLPVLVDILFRDAVNTTLGTSIDNLAPSNLPRTDLVAAFLTGIDGLNQPDGVVASEMMRLNMGIPATPRNSQSTLGVAGDDLAGFPNGRRPGDDTVDIALRVAMGALCYPVPINGTPTDLGFCDPSDAPVGNVPFTDGAPISALELQNTFPYLNSPIPGSPNN